VFATVNVAATVALCVGELVAAIVDVADGTGERVIEGDGVGAVFSGSSEELQPKANKHARVT
jgi:hypothetical protein